MKKRTRWLAMVLIVCAAPAGAAIFTVGPDGTYDTVQAALDTATAGGVNEIRVEAGTYAENLSVLDLQTDFGITVSGGWDASFASRVRDASATVIDGNGAGPCLDVSLKNQGLHLDGLTFTRGVGANFGGVRLVLRGDSTGEVRNCRFTGNVVDLSGVEGGGLQATISDTSSLVIGHSAFVANSIDGQDSIADGAGLSIRVEDSAALVMEDNVIADNTSASSDQATGGGLLIETYGSATAELTANIVARNVASLRNGSSSVGGGAAFWGSESSSVTATLNAFLGNGVATDSYCEQLSLIASGSSSELVSDSLVADGRGAKTSGINIDRRDSATMDVTNVTVAGNPSVGISANAEGGTLVVANSIASGNGSDTTLFNGATVATSMVGGDPMFVDPAHWDYRLLAGSPAIDAGDDAPPGGLGGQDLALTPRKAGAHVDQGAYEHRQEISVIPVVAHLFGAGHTPFRSSLSAANLADALTDFDLAFVEGGHQTETPISLPGSQTDTFGDIVVNRLGFPSSQEHSGALRLVSDSPGLAFSSRTFADPGGGAGTYGQFLPAVDDEDMLAAGETAIVPLVRYDAGFYTNVGMVNGGDVTCSGEVRLFDASGTQVGTTQTMTAGPREWAQIYNVFAKASAGAHSVAYAAVDVATPGGNAWFYGSVVDRTTKDPTTVPMQAAMPAGSVLLLPAAAHLSGAGGTPWRTTFGVVDAGSGAAAVTLTYRSGTTTKVRTVTVPAGAVRGWGDLLVELFGYGEGASTSGSVEITADQPLVAAGRSYADMGAGGTYGQYLPALDAATAGTGSLVSGVLTQLRKDGSFYTNVGFQNLGRKACDVRVTIVGVDGSQLGSPVTRTVAGGAWDQIYNVFGAAGAGRAAAAYAVVDVLTPGGRVWAYASVVDSVSRDPTTVPLARPWVIGPPIT